MKTHLALFSIVFAVGCGTSKVIQTGPDAYSVSSSGAGFAVDGVKENVYKAANEFCRKKNLAMVETSINTQAGGLGSHPPSADLRFRCLKASEQDGNRGTSDEQDKLLRASRTNQTPANADDKFLQLKQLKELLDSGVLTQNEFSEQKAKILAR